MPSTIQPRILLTDLIRNFQRLAATLPPDDWDTDAPISVFQRERSGTLIVRALGAMGDRLEAQMGDHLDENGLLSGIEAQAGGQFGPELQTTAFNGPAEGDSETDCLLSKSKNEKDGYDIEAADYRRESPGMFRRIRSFCGIISRASSTASSKSSYKSCESGSACSSESFLRRLKSFFLYLWPFGNQTAAREHNWEKVD